MAKKPTKSAPLLENPEDPKNWRHIITLQPFLFRYSFDPKDKDRVGMMIPGKTLDGSRQANSVLLSWDPGKTEDNISFQPMSELGAGVHIEFFRYLYENEHVEIYGSQKEANQGEAMSAASTFREGAARVNWLDVIARNPSDLSIIPPGIVFRVRKMHGTGEGEDSIAVIGRSSTNRDKDNAANVVNLHNSRRGYRVLTLQRAKSEGYYRFLEVIEITDKALVHHDLRHAVILEATPRVSGLPMRKRLVPLPDDHPAHAALAADPLDLAAIPFGVPFIVRRMRNGREDAAFQAVRCLPGSGAAAYENEDHLRLSMMNSPAANTTHLTWLPMHGRNQTPFSFRFDGFVTQDSLHAGLLSLCRTEEVFVDEAAPLNLGMDPDIEAALDALRQDPLNLEAIPNGVPYFRVLPPGGDVDALLCVNVAESTISSHRHILIEGHQWNTLEGRTRRNWQFHRFATREDLANRRRDVGDRFRSAAVRFAEVKPSESAKPKKPVKRAARKSTAA